MDVTPSVVPGSSPLTRGNDPTDLAVNFPSGSSPLTRGKPPSRRNRLPTLGLIPAHAGKTTRKETNNADQQAHPRSRGENTSADVMSVTNSGSSPLTRGKLGLAVLSLGFGGLIPAHAGKTTTSVARQPPSRAHPRSRGENASRDAHSSEQTGSSPLTRGKRRVCAACASAGRLIPAHAGKTGNS